MIILVCGIIAIWLFILIVIDQQVHVLLVATLGCYKKTCHQFFADVGLPILLWQSGLFRCILKGQVLLFEILICFVRRLFLSTLIFIAGFFL